MNAELIKESEDPESTSDLRTVSRRELEVKESVSESGVKRVDVLRVTVLTQGSSMQSSSHMGSQGLLSLFLILSWVMQGSPDCPG